ncbi:MAG TPA: hypothetical protein VJ841_04170 [Candidatus Saccharimonadales bacterium]|nr:hypothetical protein [Candidatus Saccharimonadales bacterium]
MSFFTPEERRAREEAIRERDAGQADNDRLRQAIIDEVYPEALQKIREAFTSGARGAYFSINKDPDAFAKHGSPCTVNVCDVLKQRLDSETGMDCSVRANHGEWSDGIDISVTFP